MLRHYYVTDDLNEIAQVEHQLEDSGFTQPQIHVLSEKDADVNEHQLPEVAAVLKQDVVHSTEMGALVGVLGAIATLLLTYFMGWHQTAAGWIPFIFLSIVILGFCTWEGGFIGIQKPNVNFEKFQRLLRKGKHILFVDVEPEQEVALASVMKAHPKMHSTGFGESRPSWVVRAQDKFNHFMKVMP